MRRTYPAQSSNQSGFTLIEVLIAVVVVALTTAAAASAILLSQKMSNAAAFDRNARSSAVHVHATAYSLLDDEPTDPAVHAGLEKGQEQIQSTDGSGLSWDRYRLRQKGGHRSINFSIAVSPEPGKP